MSVGDAEKLNSSELFHYAVIGSKFICCLTRMLQASDAVQDRFLRNHSDSLASMVSLQLE